MNEFEFFGSNCPKKDLGLETEKSNAGIRIIIVETLCVDVEPNWTTFTFLVQIYQKMNF